MADSDNSGGLASGLSGLMRLADPQLLISVGAGLMSGARYGSNAGEGLLQGLNMYQNMKASGLQRQLMQQQIQAGAINNQRQQMMLGAAQQALGGQPPGPAAPPALSLPGPGTSAGPFLPGISAMPPSAGTASLSSTASQGGDSMPGSLAPPSLDQIYGATYPGSANPNYLRAMAMFSQDPAAALLKVREDQLKNAQQQYAPFIAKLTQLQGSSAPSKFLNSRAYQDIKSGWSDWAGQRGLDPRKDYNDDNVRSFLSDTRNQFAASLSEPTEAPPLRTIKLSDGRTAQVDASGKITPISSDELQSVIGQNGQPALVPRSQAAGMTPFNPSIFGAANMSDQALQFAADTYRTTGKLPASMGRNPAMQARVLEKVAQDASASGDTAGAIAARTASLKAGGQALDQNTKLEAATTSYYNTLDKNLTKLSELQGKVDTSGVPLFNKVYRAWQQNVSGSPDVAAYVTYLNSAAAEFAKIQSGSLGNAPVSDSARKHADEIINKYMSSGQIQAVVDAMRGEGNNRLSSIRDEGQALRQSLGVNAPGSQPPTGTVGSAPVRLQPGQSHSVGGFTVTRVN